MAAHSSRISSISVKTQVTPAPLFFSGLPATCPHIYYCVCTYNWIANWKCYEIVGFPLFRDSLGLNFITFVHLFHCLREIFSSHQLYSPPDMGQCHELLQLWVVITTVQLYNGCLKSNLNASNEILGESSESRFNVRNYSIVEAWLPVFGSHQLKLVSKDITEKTEGQNYKHRLWVVEKKGSSFQASHGRESSSPENTRPRFDLCWFILFILYMPRFERLTNKRKQRRGTFPECSQDLYFLLTVLTSPCLQHHLFHFLSALPSPIPTWIFAVVSLFPSPLKNTTPALLLPPVPPPWTSSASAPPRNKAMQSSSTIFSHIYSFSLRFVKRLRQFYTVFPSGSAPFSALIVFQRRLYVLKTLNTITAPAILKN